MPKFLSQSFIVFLTLACLGSAMSAESVPKVQEPAVDAPPAAAVPGPSVEFKNLNQGDHKVYQLKRERPASSPEQNSQQKEPQNGHYESKPGSDLNWRLEDYQISSTQIAITLKHKVTGEQRSVVERLPTTGKSQIQEFRLSGGSSISTTLRLDGHWLTISNSDCKVASPQEDRKRYESLSDKAREKFRDMMRSKFSDEKFRNAPEEERRNIIRKEFDRIEKEDKGGK